VELAPADIIRLEPDAVVVLDQTLLPQLRAERRCTSVPELITAIRVLAIRGAPALGVAGAMGVALAAAQAPVEPPAFRRAVTAAAAMLAAARPTAVNLAVGVQYALSAAHDSWEQPEQARRDLATAARAFHAAEVERCRRIGAHGATLFDDGARICTICNAGALATGGYGTALGVIRSLHEAGRAPSVWVPETRPLLQGARLTAWELGQAGIPHRVLPDGAVASRFALGEIDGVVVGADRIAANGDTANKIGTYMLAVLAHHHGVPFHVAAPRTTIDPATPDGAAIPIEERAPAELGVTVPADSPVANPAFDVTPAALIDSIITEDGVFRGPFAFDA
jgi:methylthioribose-1-phosphate isomerase